MKSKALASFKKQTNNSFGAPMKKNEKALIRQTTIWSRLNAGERVNVKALAEEFNVSLRTIQKDMNERLSTTYDIEDLGHGDYAFAEGYRFVSADDEEEKIAISLMKSLQHSAIPQMDSFIDSTIPTGKNYEELFLFDLDFETIEDIGMFKVILKAIKWRVGLEFSYTKNDGSTKEVSADPYRIANFKNYWYLIAYDPQAEILKTYYLGGIGNLKTLFENFTGNPAIEKQLDLLSATIDTAWFNNNAKRVTLRASGDARHYLERHPLSHLELTESSEAHILFRLSYYHEVEVLSLVKKWLPDIEIVDNPLLSNKLDQTLQGYLGRKK